MVNKVRSVDEWSSQGIEGLRWSNSLRRYGLRAVVFLRSHYSPSHVSCICFYFLALNGHVLCCFLVFISQGSRRLCCVVFCFVFLSPFTFIWYTRPNRLSCDPPLSIPAHHSSTLQPNWYLQYVPMCRSKG